MTYSGVGSVVPSMMEVSTTAISQNATRGTVVDLSPVLGRRPVAAGSSRQSMQGWSGISCAAGAGLCMWLSPYLGQDFPSRTPFSTRSPRLWSTFRR